MVVDDYLLAIDHLEARLMELDAQLATLATTEPYREPVGWLRCFRGIDTLTAMLLLAELHDVQPPARGHDQFRVQFRPGFYRDHLGQLRTGTRILTRDASTSRVIRHLRRMRDAPVRRLPVVSDMGHLVNAISIDRRVTAENTVRLSFPSLDSQDPSCSTCYNGYRFSGISSAMRTRRSN